jgi:hypothetical protein
MSDLEKISSTKSTKSSSEVPCNTVKQKRKMGTLKRWGAGKNHGVQFRRYKKNKISKDQFADAASSSLASPGPSSSKQPNKVVNNPVHWHRKDLEVNQKVKRLEALLTRLNKVAIEKDAIERAQGLGPVKQYYVY